VNHKELKSYVEQNTIGNWVLVVIYAIAGSMILYFLSTKAFPKLMVTEAVYGDYYWPKAPWLLVHVVSGILATLIGPFQFISRIRTNYLATHRILGKIYLGCILIASFTAVYLAASSQYNLMGKISLGFVPVIWISCAGMAYISVLNKRIKQHREWMTRSYVVTLFFITFVTIDEFLPYSYFGTYAETLPLLTWVSWSVPLFITELILQGRKIKN